MNRYFIDGTVTASFMVYGEPKTKVFTINGVFSFTDDELDTFQLIIIQRFCVIEYDGRKWTLDKVKYTPLFRTVNRLTP